MTNSSKNTQKPSKCSNGNTQKESNINFRFLGKYKDKDILINKVFDSTKKELLRKPRKLSLPL